MNDSEPPSDLSETEFLALVVKLEQGLRAFARVLVPDWDLVDESLQEAVSQCGRNVGSCRVRTGLSPELK